MGAFAFTIDLSLFIMITTIMLIQGLEKVMVALFPLTNLIYIVFSIAIFSVGIYFNQNSYYTSAMPIWAVNSLFFIAIFVLIIGLMGYYSGTRGRFTYLLIYIIILSMSSFLSLVAGIAMIIKTSTIKEAVAREWIDIQYRLKEAGYEISESTFSNFLDVNLKFGGLFVIVYCLFLILGLFPAIYLSVIMKKKNVVLAGIGGKSLMLTPYRLNSEQTSPKLRI